MSQNSQEKLRLSLAAPAASGLLLPSDLSLKVPMSITGRRQTELDAAVNEIGKNVTGIQGDVKSGRPRSALRHDRTKARSLGCGLCYWRWTTSRSDRSPKNTLTKHSTPMSGLHCAEGTATDARGCYHHPECLNCFYRWHSSLQRVWRD